MGELGEGGGCAAVMQATTHGGGQVLVLTIVSIVEKGWICREVRSDMSDRAVGCGVRVGPGWSAWRRFVRSMPARESDKSEWRGRRASEGPPQEYSVRPLGRRWRWRGSRKYIPMTPQCPKDTVSGLCYGMEARGACEMGAGHPRHWPCTPIFGPLNVILPTFGRVPHSGVAST